VIDHLGMTVTEAGHMAQDRHSFKTTVMEAKFSMTSYWPIWFWFQLLVIPKWKKCGLQKTDDWLENNSVMTRKMSLMLCGIKCGRSLKKPKMPMLTELGYFWGWQDIQRQWQLAPLVWWHFIGCLSWGMEHILLCPKCNCADSCIKIPELKWLQLHGNRSVVKSWHSEHNLQLECRVALEGLDMYHRF